MDALVLSSAGGFELIGTQSWAVWLEWWTLRGAKTRISAHNAQVRHGCRKHTPGQRTASPVLDVRGIQLECRIMYKTPMDPAHMDPALGAMYPKNDYHTLYFGEILACYE